MFGDRVERPRQRRWRRELPQVRQRGQCREIEPSTMTLRVSAVADCSVKAENRALLDARSRCVSHQSLRPLFAARHRRSRQIILLSHHAGSHSSEKQRENGLRDVLDEVSNNERPTSGSRMVGRWNLNERIGSFRCDRGSASRPIGTSDRGRLGAIATRDRDERFTTTNRTRR